MFAKLEPRTYVATGMQVRANNFATSHPRNALATFDVSVYIKSVKWQYKDQQWRKKVRIKTRL